MTNNYYKKSYLDEDFGHLLDHLDRRWVVSENKLRHEFKFDNFKEAINFVNKVADLAEKEDHHPDMTISYNKVLIELFTHKENKITEKDLSLAQKIEELLK